MSKQSDKDELLPYKYVYCDDGYNLEKYEAQIAIGIYQVAHDWKSDATKESVFAQCKDCGEIRTLTWDQIDAVGEAILEGREPPKFSGKVN